MDDLPDEILVMILKKYSYASELFVWRLVSKRFRNLIDNHLNLKELIIRSKLQQFVVFLSQSNQYGIIYSKEEPVDYRNFIQMNEFKPPERSSFQMLCTNLKYLKIDILLSLTEGVVETLNKLIKLEELVLECLAKQGAFKAELSLPNLRRFFLKNSQHPFKLIINSRLKQLYNGSSVEIDLKNPDHLECLLTRETSLKQLSSFKNLRVFNFFPSFNRKQQSTKFLSFLDSLEEIYLKINLVKFKERAYFDQVASVVDELLNKKRILKRDNFKIYFANILVTRPFKDYNFRSFQRPYFYLDAMVMHHYHYRTDCLSNHT